MPRHRVKVPLRWSDVDTYGHVNNVEFLRLLEEARVLALYDWAPEGEDCLVTGGLLVADARIDYLAPLEFRPRPVPIDVWVTDVRIASFRFCYEIRDAENLDVENPDADTETVCARAETTMVLFDLAAGRPRRMAQDERSELQAHAGDPVVFKRA